ncbi:TPA: gamma-mobile-trio protein GmtX [Vibrio parahaemolyticus]
MQHDVDTVLKSLLEDSTSNVETRLKAVNKIILGFKKNNVDLTVPNVVGALEATGVKMSASSLYNKTVRGKPNPYRVLYDAWLHEINKAKVNRVSTEYSPTDFTSMTDADFATIASDVVKFKVQTLYNELKSARHQINMLKQIHNLPIIEDKGEAFVFHRSSPLDVPSSASRESKTSDSSDQLADEYIETIHSFLNGNSKVEFDEDGCLVSKTSIRKGDVLSELDLKEAIEAALKALAL